MDLSKCSLLVLAGCDTGIGWHDPGDGIFGIRRGAMLAGCRQLLLSLWPIDDQQSFFYLLIDFYGDYLRTRDAIGAMGRVQRHWLRDLRKNHSMSEICRLGAAFMVTIQGASDLKSPAD